MKRRSFVEEAALGVAEAVASDRVFAAFVLLGSVLFLRDARWDIGAMFLAGAAVSQSPAKTRILVFLFAAGVARGLDSDFPVREWADVDLGIHYSPMSNRYIHVAGCLVACAVGMRSVLLTVLGAALGIFAPLVRHDDVTTQSFHMWTVGSCGIALIGSTGRARVGMAAALFVLVATSAMITGGSVRPAASAEWLASHAVGIATEAAFVLWPVVAGLAAREMRQPLERKDPVRLLVLIQRRPWFALSGVAAFTVLYGCQSFPLGAHSPRGATSLLVLALLGLGSSLLVSLAAGGRSIYGSLAALFWLSAPIIAAWGSRSTPAFDARAVVVQTAFAAFFPLLLLGATRDSAGRWVTSRGLATLLALLIVQAVLRAGCDWAFEPFGWGSSWLWLLIAPVMFLAATHVSAAPWRIVSIASALGVAWWLALVAGGARLDRYGFAEAVGIWFLGGVYVVIARRANSLTAVPLDHPSVSEAA